MLIFSGIFETIPEDFNNHYRNTICIFIPKKRKLIYLLGPGVGETLNYCNSLVKDNGRISAFPDHWEIFLLYPERVIKPLVTLESPCTVILMWRDLRVNFKIPFLSSMYVCTYVYTNTHTLKIHENELQI